MALVSFSPILSDARGAAGSDVFKTINGNSILRKTYMRHKTYPINAAIQKANFKFIVKFWRRIPQYHRDEWNSLAIQLAASQIKFFKKPLSGYNLFVSCNLNLKRWGSSYHESPANIDNLLFPNITQVVMTANSTHIFITPYHSVPSSYKLEAVASPMISPGITIMIPFLYMGLYTLGLPGKIDIINEWQSIFGNRIIPFQKIFSKIRWIDTYSGFASPWYLSNCIIS